MGNDTSIIRNFVNIFVLLVSAMTLLSCDRRSQHDIAQTDGKDIVVVHAGAETGAYAKLVRLLNERGRTLPGTCTTDATAEDVADSSLNLFGEQASNPPCMAEFKFEVACTNGGTIPNLKRLGMPSLNGKLPDRTCIPSSERTIKPDMDDIESINEFALAQNFFIHGAATKRDAAAKALATRCQIEKLSKKKYSTECEQTKAEHYLRDSDYFEELRIVLPMYYGRIQLISTNKHFSGSLSSDSIKELKGQAVFLGNSVNTPHGREILRRHPILVDGMNEAGNGEKGMDALTFDNTEAKAALAAKFGDRFSGLSGQKRLGNVLLACGIVRAYVISGEVIKEQAAELPADLPEGCAADISLRQVPIPEVIIDGMVEDHSYYQKLDAPESLQTAIQLPDLLKSLQPDDMSMDQPASLQAGFTHKMPAVTTYLVTTSSTNDDLVMRVTGALYEDWSNLMLINSDLVPIADNIYKLPAPLHTGATQALQSAGVIGKDWLSAWWALAFSLTLMAAFFRTEISYDRLGTEYSRLKWLVLARLGLIVIGTGMIFVLIVKLIRFLEEYQASGRGTDNPIANKGFEEVLLWMFTFVSSGYENNVFPRSPWSIFVVALFATVGVALPIWLIVKVIDHMREASLSRARGYEYSGWWERTFGISGYRRNGVLLLCGWNNKSPGLVYTLTCPDSPYQGLVNIVADMDVEYPIRHYRFNSKRVKFYRGDPAHRTLLEKADGLQAKSALILADYNSGSSSNSTGVLTALALRKLEEKREIDKLFVAAEMSLTESDRQFSADHINDIVDPRLITRRMLSMACFNEHIVDFVLDALSPDEHSEWYAVDEKVLNSRFLGGKRGATVEEYCRAMQQHEMSIVGICPEQDLDFGDLFSPDFKEAACIDPLISRESIQRPMPSGSYVVFAAENPKSFNRPRLSKILFNKAPAMDPTFSVQSILPEIPEKPKILIVGHKLQANSLAKHIADSCDVNRTATIATDDTKDSDKAVVKALGKGPWSHIILLSSLPESFSAAEYERYSKQADTETILRASLISSSLQSGEARPTIVAEINNTHSSQLARDAMVTSVIPSALLVERILARLVSGRGHVAEMLSAMMLTNVGVYLQSQRVAQGDALIGKTVSQVLCTWFADGRVLGVWTREREAGLTNESGDFDRHFSMCPTKKDRDIELREGDLVIVLAYPKVQDAN
jgi:hypothetical protein